MKRHIAWVVVLLLALAGFQTAVAEGKVIRYLGRSATFDLANNPVMASIEELTGFTLECEALPAGDDGNNKLMLLMSSNIPYDIVNGFPEMYDRLLAANVLIPLNDLLKDAPNLMAAVPADSESWKRVTAPDGTIYGIPQLNPTGGTVYTIVMRKDILDELGLAVPDSAEAFYQALKAIKESKPDMIPFTTAGGSNWDEWEYSAPNIASAFGVYKDWQEQEDGSILHKAMRSEHKDYITYLATLYKEGLMDPEFPANDRATRLQKFTSGKAAATLFGGNEGPNFYSTIESMLPQAEIVYLNIFPDANGQRGVTCVGGLEKICMIPKTCKDPKTAIAYIDAFMANFQQLYIGTEGVSYTVENGQYRPIMPAFADFDSVWWFIPAVDEDNVFDYWQARVRKNEEVERGYADTFALRTEDVDAIIPQFALLPVTEKYAKLNTSLSQLWKDEMIKLITGATPIDQYDKAIEKWRSAGGDDFMAEANLIWQDTH